ncbi:malectin domain-containing carbohydrate-binding protein [Sphingobacterium bovistauri]|nr:malectin domain-containing carbohydrate-binding protein [Sphingobacterium bovistauri]
MSNLCSFGQEVRITTLLNDDWITRLDTNNSLDPNSISLLKPSLDKDWKSVSVPHNWDDYYGYRRLFHGNLHTTAWYKKTFETPNVSSNKRFYLFFEGVGSYATVWLNGTKVGSHAGGRTTFTLDISKAIHKDNKKNTLIVKAEHPLNIRDLPWVDGGSSTERGFSEGSQPLGIFRPVSLVIKNDVNIVPFGTHYWNDTSISAKQAEIQQTVELTNTSNSSRKLIIRTRVLDPQNKPIYSTNDRVSIESKATKVFSLSNLQVLNPKLWSIEQPHLYSMETSVLQNGKIIDQQITKYGIRKFSWTKNTEGEGYSRLYLNDKPVFINGIAEYEHKFGNSHAFTDAEVYARASEMKSLGFNSFRDAHQPHNLRYQEYWDRSGVLLWTQMSAHIWFDNTAFKENFKTLLAQWVKERRNSPSVFLWGIQNESKLPEYFAQECTEIIRQLDPTASKQRLVTTCNGGKGTDWDVPQNWTGTYGGHHNTYGEDLKRQKLVGEFGAWRTLELHVEQPYLPNDNVYSEGRFTEILETKIRLADSVKDEIVGHYHWLWTSHDNPGRVQGGEGYRDIDKIGPVNYKGLLTPWLEPTDAYFMYRANYAPQSDPMLYIASHTWPNRWLQAGIKNDIRIYSNCDEVELYNDIDNISLGKQSKGKIGTHFQFNNVPIQYNVLYAVGRIDNRIVARDTIVLFNLPQSPSFYQLVDSKSTLLKGKQNLNYLYRVNCGGDSYTDTFGQKWLADKAYDGVDWGAHSWTDEFSEINPLFASQRRVFDPIKGTADWPLFQTFRYGLHKMGYTFHLPNGEYEIELYFAEPWIGTGGALTASGRRLFDIRINNQTVEKDLDIWKSVGHDKALKKTYRARVVNGILNIDFPKVSVGQVIINAIAVASVDKNKSLIANVPYNIIGDVSMHEAIHSALDIGSMYNEVKQKSIHDLAPSLYGSYYLVLNEIEDSKRISLAFKYATNLYLITNSVPKGFEITGDSIRNNHGEKFAVFRKIINPGEKFELTHSSAIELVAYQRISGIQPAYDLKKAKVYKADQSKIYKDVIKVHFMEQDRFQFTDKNSSMVGWEIAVGAADIYALTFKYHNPLKESKVGYYEVLYPDGTVLKERTKVLFDPTREGKWNYLNENTTTMINAGTYIVNLYSEDADDIMLDYLEVK